MFRVGFVGEGPTDKVLLEALLQLYVNDEVVVDALQPDHTLADGEAGPRGGGRQGVKRWCEEASADGLWGRSLLEKDLWVFHLDADVADDLGLSGPCPPVMDAVQALRARLLKWLGLKALPSHVVCWIPSKATEAWLLPVFFPRKPLPAACASGVLECHPNPGALLLQETPKFVRMKQNKLRKRTPTYRAEASRFASGWSQVLAVCESARAFDTQLRSALS